MQSKRQQGAAVFQPALMPTTIRSARHQRLAEILREARKASGLQQADVAKALGRHQPFIANIERGQRRVDAVEILTLARLLDLDPVDVLKTLQACPMTDRRRSASRAAAQCRTDRFPDS